ncbi:MAG: acyl--CoA ligase [Bacilli bacterium]|nr:acyl--CoA ligase [Bacilli bacterium]
MNNKSIIRNLEVNEAKQSELETAKLKGTLTGYPSFDKPQKQYYREEPIKEINPNQTIYDMVFDQEDLNAEAIGYLGTNWTFKKLKEKVDDCSKAFASLGVSKGDSVLVGISNSPEAVVTLLALNRMGAISKWFDIRASVKDIEEYANSSNCKCMLAYDMIVPKVKQAIDNTDLNSVIVLSPANAISSIKRGLYNLKNTIKGEKIQVPDDKRFISFDKFMRKADLVDEVEKVSYDENRPSVMIQSSGTTGKPKTIIHSDHSAIECVRELAYSDLPLGKSKTALVALPPWIAYGIGEAILMPLAFGSKVELCPNFDSDIVFKNLGKFTISFAAPFHYRYLKDNIDKLSTKQRNGLKNVECFISGGDKVSVQENREWEETFDTVVVNGYGNNEGWGALSVNPTKHNRYGTVGIPKYDEIVISYDNDKKEELKYGEVGEICSLANTMFMGYENNEKETKNVKKKHSDNNTWLHTGDLGYIDEDGYIHLEGRARRVITRLGFKISAYTIEDNISQNDSVKECVAVAVKDEAEEHVPMIYIVLKEQYTDVNYYEQQIIDNCKKTLKEYEVPKYFKVVEELPYTQNGKYDFRVLEKLGNDYVDSLSKGKNKINVKKK